MPAPRDDEIFGEAIELPLAERAAFLDRACAGDAALRARLDALLAGYDAADRFLEQPAIPRPPGIPEPQPGDVIDRYTLLKKIGEGGCGAVYLAEQTTPVRRRVALKIIKVGMDTRAVIARFEAERQALALMDHPDIARVFDAGATATGRPYFVMEFVDGVPITRFCDEHAISTAQRLELFARVCLALQHAHQKGIIHRDLKPSNILVALRDGVPTPKIIDFGIAKATSGRLTEHTLLTGLEQFIGTPAYMSPEQAELRDLDIDTRSDVYALGVLLYELLTGRPPFDPQSLVQAGIDEIRRILREVDPPRPSTRLTTLTDADRATVAKLRQSAPAQLSTTLRGDLDWIVMRCLEKDRDRRYGTAHELADDIRRHLRSEPVTARPPSASYRARKFIRRNRLACASAAALAAALIAGTIVSTHQAIRATRAERTALAARDAAEIARRAEALARTDAQRRQEQAEALLTFMLGDFRAELKKLGKLSLLDAIGDKAMAHFAALDPQDLTDTALNQQARALTQIGETRLDQARYADAVAAFETAYRRTAALVARHPKNADMLFERAQAEYWIGFAARRRGDFATASEWLTHYRDSALALARLEGNTVRACTEVSYGHHNLAVLDTDRGHLAAAREGFLAERESVAALLAADPKNTQLAYRLADIASWLGTIAEQTSEYSVALDYYRENAQRLANLSEAEPDVPRWKSRRADALTFVGNILMILGQRQDAAELFDQAIGDLEKLIERDPKNSTWRVALVTAQLRKATQLCATGNPVAGQTLVGQTRQPLESLLANDPSSTVYPRFLALGWHLDALVRVLSGASDAAASIDRALKLGEPLAAKPQADRFAISEFAQACILAGRIAAAEGRNEQAQAQWQRALDVLKPRLAGSDDSRFLDPAAQALTLLGRSSEARPLIEKLKKFGYHTTDPLASPLLDLVAVPNSSSPHP